MWHENLDGLTFREQANLVKQGFLFVFCSTEDLQKMPLGKLSFFAQFLGTMFFMSKQVSLPKIS